jgi:hypothetical protein
MSNPPHRPRFCTDCGTALPADPARFCIECGAAIRGVPTPVEDEPPDTAPSFQLPNARAPQQVIGGTVKLPASGAVPPGLWVLDQPPGPDDVVAIYPPLRPVRGGWSGLVGRGWHATGNEARGSRTIFHFRAEVPWFPAPGCGGGLQLRTEVTASSRAWEGRERRGFRFGVSRDGPMVILHARWHDADGRPLEDRPLPQIQIMAPPRVARISDFDEEVGELDAREAALWVGESQAPGAYRLVRNHVSGQLVQEHTPVGRGITLTPLRAGREGPLPWWGRLLPGIPPIRYRARVLQPFSCSLAEWETRLELIGNEARALGLDLDPALAAEWWLDRNGHDGVIFSAAQARYQVERVLIVFRRAQLMRIKD